MSETSGPFDPVDPENPVAPGEVLAEADWESMLAHIVDGIPDLPTSTQLKPSVSESTARGVDLAAGLMLVAGHWYRNSAVKTITSSANSSGAARIDRAVARLNRTANTVTAELLTGTPGSGQPPALTDNATTTERLIARWTIGNGGTAATGLVDERRFLAGATLLCTSSTRPATGTVRAGQLAYETNTGRLILFDGSTWSTVYRPPLDQVLSVSGSGWSVSGASMVLRRRGDMVTLRYGTLTRTGGTVSPDVRLPGTIPADFIPAEAVYSYTGGSGADLRRVTVYPTGDSRVGQIWFTAGASVPSGGTLLGFSTTWAVTGS